MTYRLEIKDMAEKQIRKIYAIDDEALIVTIAAVKPRQSAYD
ncbi:MAG: hypothetical protein NT018_01500 [Armatimonadetes bacterium]|nr:hypothetical protein [Armatimonadota bacterium]